MELAERWSRGWLVALVATSTLAVTAWATHRDPVAPPVAEARVHLDHDLHCAGRGAVSTPAPVDPYQRVFSDAAPDLAPCFDGHGRVDLLIEIARDGHVTHVSNRPERETKTSRCVERVVQRLQFPVTDSVIAIRVPLTAR